MALGFKMINTGLMAMGVLSNPYMDGVLTRRAVPVFPDENGNREKPSDREICVIMLAARSNHPLGMFNEGIKKVGFYFDSMMKQLEEDSTKHGFLGASRWISSADRGVSSELMNLLYFDSVDSLHAYAHGPLHTEALKWWDKDYDKLHHVAIMHEAGISEHNSFIRHPWPL